MKEGCLVVGEEEIVPVGVVDRVDDLEIRHFNLKFHRPLQASLFELRPDKSLESQRAQRLYLVFFICR